MKTYNGSCHCGAYKFSVDLDLDHGAIVCNCSMCSRAGYMLAFAKTDQFHAKTDDSALKDYRFNKKKIAHLFCTTCGIHPIGRGVSPKGEEMMMVNVRCLEGIEDLTAIDTKAFDGRSA
jgi:hypothetical protein